MVLRFFADRSFILFQLFDFSWFHEQQHCVTQRLSGSITRILFVLTDFLFIVITYLVSRAVFDFGQPTDLDIYLNVSMLPQSDINFFDELSVLAIKHTPE